MQYNIADIMFEVGGDFTNQYAENRMREYLSHSLFQTNEKFVVECYENDNIVFPDTNPVTQKVNNWKWFIEDENIHMFDVNSGFDFILSSMSWNSNTKRAVIQAHDTCPFTGVELTEIFFNLMGTMFGYILPDYDGVAIHSSAMAYKNNGILVSAPSGTGKSTHTGLWKKYFPNDVTIINDDRPIIRKVEGKFYVYGAPWSGKTSLNSNVRVPLKTIVCIRQGETNSVKRIYGKQAFFNLLNETYTIPVENYMSKTLDILNEILETIPIYELKCTISEDAVNLLKSELDI